MPYIEDFDEFAKRMNCPYVRTRGLYLFENGGRSSGDEHEDPPEDRQTQLKMQGEYVQVNLRIAEKKFRELQQYIVTQSEFHAANAGPAPEEEAIEELERLQTEVFSLREMLDEKMEKFTELSGPSPAEEHLRYRESQRRKSEKLIEKARQIEI